MDDLRVKHRPTTFAGVIGQGMVVKSLEASLKRDAHSFLFSGPSGTGKTTLARIVALTLGCDSINLTEIDAATFTGIDAMRTVTETLQYLPTGKSKVKVVIIDEAHALSKAAWDSLLKSIEEPPKHVYWCLCTTNPDKVPATIKTRCISYTLKPVKADDLFDFLVGIAKKEKLNLSEDVISFIADCADGSPRQALSLLTLCSATKTVKEAAALMERARGTAGVIDLCRLINAPSFSWNQAMTILQKIGTTNPEDVRRPVIAYFLKAAMGENNKHVEWHLQVLQTFQQPIYLYDSLAPIVVMLGELRFAD